MARFIADYQLNKPDDFIKYVSDDFFAKEGFEYMNYQGEMVWKKGIGMLTAPQFIKIQYANGWVHVEAWLKWAILPGVYSGEMGLDGFVGALPKSQLKQRVETLMAYLNQNVEIPQTAMAGAAAGQPMDPSAPAQPYPVAAQPIQVAVHDPVKKATTALITGILSIVFCWIPLAGIILGCIGIGSGSVGRKSSQKGKATAGFVLSIIGVVISGLLWLLNLLSIFA